MTSTRLSKVSAERLPAYGSLLATIFLLLMLSPVLTASPVGWVVGRLLGGSILIAALLALGMRRGRLVLMGLLVLAIVVAGNTGVLAVESGSTAGRLLFLLFVEARIVSQVLRATDVGWDTVAGAAAGYVVLGVIWGDIFLLLERAQPGSFTVPAGFAIGAHGDLRAALTYFSFVTLTTVGYGVIHPASIGAGGVCVAEAIVGQLYLAIMISRMVGLHLSQRSSASSREGG